MKEKSRRDIKGRLKDVFRRPETALFSFYGLVTLIFTYPAIKIASHTYAESADPLGTLWWMWWQKYSFSHHLAASNMSLVAHPFGFKLSDYTVDPLTHLVQRFLAIATTETVGYNLFLLVSFFLTACVMYYLARYLTGNRGAAAFSGFAFAFCPFMLAHGKEHVGLVAAFWIPLFVLLLIKAWRKPALSSIGWTTAVFIVLTLFNYHYGLFCALFFVVFALVMLATRDRKEERGRSRRVLLVVAPIVVVILALLVVSVVLLSRSSAVSENELSVLVDYSARPWDYFIPHAEGALFGWTTGGFITSHIHGGFVVESTLFLGYVPLALAIYACVASFRKRRRRPIRGAGAGEVEQESGGEKSVAPTRDDTGRIMLSLVAVAAVAFVVSMPPTAKVLGVKIYLPSYVLFKLIPPLRAYSRFGLLVMFCVALLAGYGIAELANKKWYAKRGAFFTVLLCILVLFEFSIVPPFRGLDTKATTEYYRWLKERPRDTVAAIYPIFFFHDFDNYVYFFEQRLHEKALVNGAQDDTEAERYRQVIMDLGNPGTPGILRHLGTDYVMIIPSNFLQGHHLNYPFPVEVDPDKLPEGLTRVARFNDCLVYRVTAPPASFIPLFGEGTSQAFIDPGGLLWHPTANRVVIDIQSFLPSEASCDLSMLGTSVRSEGRLTATLNGDKIMDEPIGQSPRLYAAEGVRIVPGRNFLVVESTSPLANLSEIPGYQEVRAAMFLGNVLVVEGPRE